MKKGFTLIEIIAVLLLVSLLVLASTLALLPLVNGFAQARVNTDAAQKSFLALSRLAFEFTTITEIISSGPYSITYDFMTPAGDTVRRVVAWNGQSGAPLTLDNVPLSDDVHSFELRYYSEPAAVATSQWIQDSSRLIEIVYETFSSRDVYTKRIRPRNIPGG